MVEELGEEVGAVMDHACDRIGHVVQREVERRHDRGPNLRRIAPPQTGSPRRLKAGYEPPLVTIAPQPS